MNKVEAIEQEKQQKAIEERKALIKHTIIVLSGKGGVGKSTVAVNIAAELARDGKRVGLLDVDIHGPSVPGMLGLDGSQLFHNGTAIVPMEFTPNLLIMSIGFLLRDRGDAVIWRGPLKYIVIRQFISDVEWGELDYLIIDSPPGTGDEPLSVAQLMGKGVEALVVTTPQRVSIDDVSKSIQFCRKLDMQILGIIENMSGFVCPHCGKTAYIFESGGGEFLAREQNVTFLGQIPIEPALVRSCDTGKPYITDNRDTKTAKIFCEIVKKIVDTYKDYMERQNSGVRNQNPE
jgi:ATP-binding protein involved in chromosome partitioning